MKKPKPAAIHYDHLEGAIWKVFDPTMENVRRTCPVCQKTYDPMEWYPLHYMEVIIDGNIVRFTKVHDVVYICTEWCVTTFLNERQFQPLALYSRS